MTGSVTSAQIVRLLASADRRRVFAALTLADEALDHSQIATASHLDLRGVVDAVDRLVAARLVDDVGGSYQLVDDVFEHAARSEAPAKPPSDHPDEPEDVARVLDLAFRDGKLVQWPAKRSKRLVVLDYLSQQFEIGVRYQEPAINDMLRVFNDDVATMRRYLVDEQFLDRGEGFYWRCGGTI